MLRNFSQAIVPVARQLGGQPQRTFLTRRSLWPFSHHHVSRQLDDIESMFSRMERDMNVAFRDLNFGSPLSRMRHLLEPSFTGSHAFFPIIEAETKGGENGAKYTVKMDIGTGFNPEDIKVTLKDRMLTINAKVEQKSDDGNTRLYQEISRSVLLPESVKIDEVKSLFTPDGVLMFEAPMPEIEVLKPKEIPIAIEGNKTKQVPSE